VLDNKIVPLAAKCFVISRLKLPQRKAEEQGQHSPADQDEVVFILSPILNFVGHELSVVSLKANLFVSIFALHAAFCKPKIRHEKCRRSRDRMSDACGLTGGLFCGYFGLR
jgi:hypothetical protein